MTWTYSGNPSASDLDEVRFLIGDTDSDDQLVSNEEITYALTKGSVYEAAAVSSEAIAGKYARKADKTVDDLSIKYSQISKQYYELATKLRKKATSFNIQPYAGGISISDKVSREEDSDRVSPSFTRGMTDNENGTDEDDWRDYQ